MRNESPIKIKTFKGYISNTLSTISRVEISANLNNYTAEGAASTVRDLSNSIIIIKHIRNQKLKSISGIFGFVIQDFVLLQVNLPVILSLNNHEQRQLQVDMFRLVKSLGFRFANSVESLRRPIDVSDPEVYKIIMAEKERQFTGINLIASENYCSTACLAATGSIFNNKYAEGYPGLRYYGGTEHADKIQLLCQQRALKTFNLSPSQWGVNVQALSGSPANMAVYTGLLEPHDRIMSLDLPHGGHLSHGYQVAGKKISAVSKYFQVYPYRVDETTAQIDFQALYKTATVYRPKLIVAGGSGYSRIIDYKRFREICDQIGAYLLVDMAHPAGLIAGGVIPSPFPYADVVTTTTHKTLRGPRGSMIFYRVGTKKDKKGNETKLQLKTKIDAAVFPGLQGGPHIHTIAGIAVALGQAITPEFKVYQQQVLKNMKAGVQYLQSKGYRIVSGGTDNHLCLIDMRSKGTDGGRIQALTDLTYLFLNKNTVPGDKSALIPSGVRIGSPAMTTRGCKEADFIQVMKFLERATDIVNNVNKKAKGTKLKDFKETLHGQLESSDILNLKKDINAFVKEFPVPGGNI